MEKTPPKAKNHKEKAREDALRNNLLKRKQQQRARSNQTDDTDKKERD